MKAFPKPPVMSAEKAERMWIDEHIRIAELAGDDPRGRDDLAREWRDLCVGHPKGFMTSVAFAARTSRISLERMFGEHPELVEHAKTDRDAKKAK